MLSCVTQLCYSSLLCRFGQLQYDESAAAALESQVEAETAEVARCQERVDDLSSKLTGTSVP